MANTAYWPNVQRALIDTFRWVRHNDQGWDTVLASQLKKAYDHEFPNQRAPFYVKRLGAGGCNHTKASGVNRVGPDIGQEAALPAPKVTVAP